MVLFFKISDKKIFAVASKQKISEEKIKKLEWLFNGVALKENNVSGFFIGSRRELITPWSTGAVDIAHNMGIEEITRIEEFYSVESDKAAYDPMLQLLYKGLDNTVFNIDKEKQDIVYIDNIAEYNTKEGLALSEDEIDYLKLVEKQQGRKLTDSEVFGFSQVNSEHCRHKIFNGKFIIDGIEKESSLFALIKKTSKVNPNNLISAYSDNVSFNSGPKIKQFAPTKGDISSYFEIRDREVALSLKAETHNFPTTVEPFNGAATGAGGEIRDRLGGGRASMPLAGIAVYMTSYPRISKEQNAWEKNIKERPWLYQTPEQILVKASNGASDFGNKYGQALICGSVLTFEHSENNKDYGFDKVIMLAGGVGYAAKEYAIKGEPKVGQKIVVLGGDNYRIGMGGGAVSSVNTGEFEEGIELNAVQRSNPEMQKRVANVIRHLSESGDNPIVSIHDHGAGGHLNCFSELVEKTGGRIEIDKLPVGDKTLSSKEIIGNESQERMGIVIDSKDIPRLEKIAERENAPMYIVGQTTGDMQLVFEQGDGRKPIDLPLKAMFGNSPKTIMEDKTIEETFSEVNYSEKDIHSYIKNVLTLEAVASKDWLTNKVDRSVTGMVAAQQTQGEIQLPLSDCGVMALDYQGKAGVAISVGHAPQAAIVDSGLGSKLAVAEALTNIIWAPLKENLKSVSLSANWQWPCKNAGEDARLYQAVESLSDFCCALGINVPTGKDSLSMTQNYGDKKVFSPGAVIISASAEVDNVRGVVSSVLNKDADTSIYYIDFSFDSLKLGGSAFYQTMNKLGKEVPNVDVEYFKQAFTSLQKLIHKRVILAGHDISAGGMLTCLLEMCFANKNGGLDINFSEIAEKDLVKILFSENPGVIVQVKDSNSLEKELETAEIAFVKIGKPSAERTIKLTQNNKQLSFDIDELRDVWFKPSYLFDIKQSGEKGALARFNNYKHQVLDYKFADNFTGKLSDLGLLHNRTEKSGLKVAIIREKGTNGEREMAYALYLAGFDVKDVHMSDLISGKETLEDINFIVFCGGFSNSDVLGSAKGWAASILFNENAKKTIDNFYKRKNTLSLGVCNGCQLMTELGLIYPEHKEHPKMHHNQSGKFESGFIQLTIPANNSVMMSNMEGQKLGVWIAHGEGRFNLPQSKDSYNIVAEYSYGEYPANPNGSEYSVAGIASKDGRHLAMMPHPERAIFPWQWAYYPTKRNMEEVSPWIQAFINAREWIKKQS